MTNQNFHDLQRIADIAWNCLMSFRDNPLWDELQYNDTALSWIGVNPEGSSENGNIGDTTLDLKSARIKLEKLILGQFTKFGWCYLYTCPDNALISIDMDLDRMDQDEKEMMELQSGFSFEFRIGFD